MNKEVLTFGDSEIEKRKLYYSKYPLHMNNVDID